MILSFIVTPNTAAYRIESLHSPGYPLTVAVFMTAIKEMHCIFNIHVREYHKMIFGF
jgi:hypothetical protein